MLIKNIILVEKDKTSNDSFLRTNLLSSNDKNSVGKSTFCRLIFHSLGYRIPQTEGIIFSNIISEITFVEKDDTFVLKRNDSVITLIKNNSFVKEYILPDQHIELLRFIFSSEVDDVLNNLLGLMYIDQEKGWTLLNRGNVIGSNRFSIDRLMAALGRVDCEDLFAERAIIEKNIIKYESILNMESVREQYYEDTSNLTVFKTDDVLKGKIADLEIQISDLNEEVENINDAIIQDEGFFKFIDDMNIYVNIGDGKDPIKLSRNIIECSYNIDFLKAQSYSLRSEINRLTKRKNILRQQLLSIEELPDLFNNKRIANTEQIINMALSNINIDKEAITIELEKAKKEYNKVEKRIYERISHNNSYVGDAYKLICEYADELGVLKLVSKNSNYLFTHNLKGKTGAIFQKLIICFRVALIQLVDKYLNTRLPLVIDSPRVKELSSDNAKDLLNFINDKLPKNQIIVASIYNEEDLKFNFDKTINIKNRAIEEREFLDVTSLKPDSI